MKSYEALAEYYDKLIIGNCNLDEWVNFTVKHSHGKKLLEMACGSGSITEKLALKDYEITAFDLSFEMLKKAQEKLDSKIKLFLADMRDFQTNNQYDVVCCYNDSLNYLLEIDDLKKCFNNVYNSLNNDGVFLFDVHHISRLKEFKDEFIEEGTINNTNYQWSIVSEDDYLYHNLVFYKNHETINEEHVQRIYSKELIKKCLNECGFDTTIYVDFEKAENKNGEKYYFVCYKR